MIIEPQNIASGWLKRWSRQSMELYRRAIWFPLMMMGMQVWFYSALSTLPKILHPLILVFGGTLLIVFYVFLKAIDEDSGNIFSTAFGYITHSKWDIFKYVRWLLFIVVAYACFNLALSSTLDFFHMQNGMADKHSFVNLFQTGKIDNLSMQFTLNIVAIVVDVSLFLAYLTLLNGFNIHDNYLISGIAIEKNKMKFTPFLMLFGVINLAILGFGLLSLYFIWIYWIDLTLLSAAFLIFVTFGYLASREVFEGRKDNQKETEKAKAKITLMAGTR